MVEVFVVGSANVEQLEQVRTLLREYDEGLDVDLCFQGLQEELATLPGGYGHPDGMLLLAQMDGEPVACGAFRPVDKFTCEMKRLYVRPSARGQGLGRMIAVRLIEAAREKGYVWMRLDTLAGMTEARALYATLGFTQIEPYYYNPEKDVSFLELNLKAAVTSQTV